MMPRALVTGANGFVGSCVSSVLEDAGFLVVRAVRTANGDLPPATTVTGDLLDLPRALSDHEAIDYVVHLAARVHVMRETEQEPELAFWRTNVNGTEALARWAASTGVKRFVNLSSIGVNGEASPSGSDGFSETDPPDPQTPYAVSKWEAEKRLAAVAAETGLKIITVRPPLVCGPDAPGNLRRLLTLVHSGIPLPIAVSGRSFIGVRNLADFILTCLTKPEIPRSLYVVADNEIISSADLVRHLAHSMQRPCRLVHCPPTLVRLAARLCGQSKSAEKFLGSLLVDCGNAKKELQWTPRFTTQDELRRAAQSFLASRSVAMNQRTS
jgi:nucleoside-diphosphate-sugar epimerase